MQKDYMDSTLMENIILMKQNIREWIPRMKGPIEYGCIDSAWIIYWQKISKICRPDLVNYVQNRIDSSQQLAQLSDLDRYVAI